MRLLLITLALITTLFSAELDWPSDYDAALVQAKKENKDVYAFISSTYCKWCRKFEKTTLKDEATLKNLKEKYVLLYLDRDLDDFPEHFETKRVPRHYFLKANGDTIHTFMGYWNAEDFASLLGDVDKKNIKYKEK